MFPDDDITYPPVLMGSHGSLGSHRLPHVFGARGYRRAGFNVRNGTTNGLKRIFGSL